MFLIEEAGANDDLSYCYPDVVSLDQLFKRHTMGAIPDGDHVGTKQKDVSHLPQLQIRPGTPRFR